MVLHSTRELDEGMSGKVISRIGGSFRRNTHTYGYETQTEDIVVMEGLNDQAIHDIEF